jgi:hypothetical protein
LHTSQEDSELSFCSEVPRLIDNRGEKSFQQYEPLCWDKGPGRRVELRDMLIPCWQGVSASQWRPFFCLKMADCIWKRMTRAFTISASFEKIQKGK